MRANSLSVVLSATAMAGPWLIGASVRQHHALSLALLSTALVLLSLSLKRPLRAEHAVLPVLLAATCPLPLVWAIGLPSRAPLLWGAGAILAVAAIWRILAVMRQGDAEGGLLRRAFPRVVPVARAELALFRFGLFRWKRRTGDVPPGAEAFPSTATGTELAMCWLTAAGFMVETPMLHLLLRHAWGSGAAWACTGLHGLLAIYLVGYAKSLLFLPTLLFADRLEIRLGVVATRVVPRASIGTAALHDGTRDAGERLFGLDEPNVRLGVAGRTLLLRVDAPKRLVEVLAA